MGLSPATRPLEVTETSSVALSEAIVDTGSSLSILKVSRFGRHYPQPGDPTLTLHSRHNYEEVHEALKLWLRVQENINQFDDRSS